MIQAPVKEPFDLHGVHAVSVEQVTRSFATRRGTVTALEGMSLHARMGEIVAVVGPSCGPSGLSGSSITSGWPRKHPDCRWDGSRSRVLRTS